MLTPEHQDIAGQAAGLRRMRSAKPVKVITVTGGKGGVGKTNISANLAVAMSMLGRRVMLLDADLGLANIDVLLGLQPSHSLADVVSGARRLEEVIVTGPAGIRVIPGASGLSDMANLTPAQHAGIVNAFSELTEDLDALIVDTAAGLSESVLRFCEAGNEVLVVVCDEPTSITDAYALIKVLSTERGVSRFRIITNMTHQGGDGRHLFEKLLRVTERFLQVTLDHAGSIPVRRPRLARRAAADAFCDVVPHQSCRIRPQETGPACRYLGRAPRGTRQYRVLRGAPDPGTAMAGRRHRHDPRKPLCNGRRALARRARAGARPAGEAHRESPAWPPAAWHGHGRPDPGRTDRTARCRASVLAGKGREFRDLRKHPGARCDAG